MEAYKETKRLMLWRTVVIAATISLVSLCTMALLGTALLGALRIFH